VRPVCSREPAAMMPGLALGAGPGPDAWPRRLICVSVNAAVDRIAAVDRLVPGEVHRPEVLSVVPGGKALNVARAAANLGMPVRAIAVLGGHAGDWMEATLRAGGIATRVVRAAGETRTCLSVLDRAAGTLTEFYEPGLTLDDAGWTAVETALHSELADDPSGSVVVLAGSLPPGAPDAGYALLTKIANDAGARAVVDADRIALAKALAERPWLVKVNAREAAAAADLAEAASSGEARAVDGGGGEDSAVEAARRIRVRTGGLVLVTRGTEGAVLVEDDGAVWRIGGPPERGRYPVGSGDSLLAGFVVALAAGLPLVEAARRGGAVGAANSLVPGQGEVDTADAERMLPAIRIDRIA
jgi:1-phosphofructokinase family hexose kinase